MGSETKSKRKFPPDIFMGFDPEYGTVAYCWSDVSPCNKRYTDADLAQSRERELLRVITKMHDAVVRGGFKDGELTDAENEIIAQAQDLKDE